MPHRNRDGNRPIGILSILVSVINNVDEVLLMLSAREVLHISGRHECCYKQVADCVYFTGRQFDAG